MLSGSGRVSEHVQRLGRILRRQEGKVATLYEVITEQTSEEQPTDGGTIVLTTDLVRVRLKGSTSSRVMSVSQR